jgi:Family of unknown function (DUF6308)
MPDLFTTVPNAWHVATPFYEHAMDATLAALQHPEACARLKRYYSREGNYAGATFVEVGPFDPYSFTEGDLLALTLLEVQAPPVALRRILQPGVTRDRLNALVEEKSISIDADLALVEADTLLAMEELYLEVKQAVSRDGSTTANPWVTASKMCARKRPDLFPVRDNVVCGYLGILRAGGYQIDWQVFRHLIQSREVVSRLDELVSEAQADPDVNVGRVNNRLRHLDVVLWMHAPRGLADFAQRAS